jgi:hypothetical protein
MSLFQLSALRDKVSSRSYDIIVYNLHLTKSVFGSREKNGVTADLPMYTDKLNYF